MAKKALNTNTVLMRYSIDKVKKKKLNIFLQLQLKL